VNNPEKAYRAPQGQAGQALAQEFLSGNEPETGHEQKEQTRY